MESTSQMLSKKKSNSLSVHILDDASTLSSIATLRELFESCLGPHGRCKLVHNGTGGHVTVTSSASRLLQSAQISSPVLRLICSALTEFLKTYGDCGTMTATLALLLIERSLTEQFRVLDLFEILATECVEYLLLSDLCSARVSVNFDTLFDLVCLVKGVVSAKPVCVQSATEANHICHCIINAFLYSFHVNPSHKSAESSFVSPNHHAEGSATRQDNGSNGVGQFIRASNSESNAPDAECGASDTCTPGSMEVEHLSILPVLGYPVDDSYIVRGLLVETNERWRPTIKGALVAVFKCSMAGDCGDTVINTDQLDVVSTLDVDEILIDKMLKTVTAMVDDHSVSAIVCQKVIHPKVKRFLRRRDVLVLDRLGLEAADKLARLTGASAISSLFSVVSKEQLGIIDSVSHVVVKEKAYLCLRAEHQPMCTLVLCSLGEESVAELKSVSDSAYRVLTNAVVHRQALKGGGFWQIELAAHLRRNFSTARLIDLADQLECNIEAVKFGIECVANSLERTARIISRDDVQSDHYVVLDLALHATHAVRTALNAAQFVLGIGHYVRDTR